MQPIQRIAIPQPCHENWNQMTLVDQGRHCSSCSKIVTDFTAMSNNEIINYFAKSNNVCGRFEEQQLNAINYQLALEDKSVFSCKKFALAAALTSLFAVADANAQRTVGKVVVSKIAKDVNRSPETNEKNDTLKVTSIGFKPQKKLVDTIHTTSCFLLAADTTSKTRVILGGAISIVRRVPFYKLWWYKLKRAF